MIWKRKVLLLLLTLSAPSRGRTSAHALPPPGGPSSEPSDLGPQAEPSVSVCFDLWFPSQLSSQPDIFLFTYFLSL